MKLRIKEVIFPRGIKNAVDRNRCYIHNCLMCKFLFAKKQGLSKYYCFGRFVHTTDNETKK